MIISLTFNRTAKNVLTNYCFMLFHKKKKINKELKLGSKKNINTSSYFIWFG